MPAGIDMSLTIVRPAGYLTREQWNTVGDSTGLCQTIQPGTKVEYRGHVVGGMVAVLYEGQQVIIHPGSTKELA